MHAPINILLITGMHNTVSALPITSVQEQGECRKRPKIRCTASVIKSGTPLYKSTRTLTLLQVFDGLLSSAPRLHPVVQYLVSGWWKRRRVLVLMRALFLWQTIVPTKLQLGI